MTLLILGVVLWAVTHSIPTMARPTRNAMVARMGEGPWKGLFTVVSFVAIALMVIGYKRAEYAELWFFPWAVHLNNLLMLVAVALLGASHSKGNAKRYVRHPMLLSVIVWAVAHLLVNGDVASVVLFGGLGAWALVSIYATNARDGAWVKPAPAPRKKDFILVGITLVVFIVISVIHGLVGPSPFPM